MATACMHIFEKIFEKNDINQKLDIIKKIANEKCVINTVITLW